MASPSERRRNDMKVGVFVTLVIALALFVSVNLTDISGALFAHPRAYRVTYAIGDGVAALQAGSPVRVGGLHLGNVENVTLGTASPDGGTPEAVLEVDFTLDERIALYPTPRIVVGSSLVGADSWLDIQDLGSAAAGAQLDDGAVIDGATSSFLADALGVDPSMLMEDVESILTKVDGVVTNVDQMVAEVRAEHWGTWLAQADEIVSGVERVVQKTEAGVDDARGTLATIDDMVDENRAPIRNAIANAEGATEDVRRTLDTIDASVNENRESIRNAVANVEAITETARTETMEKIHAFLDRGLDAVDSANGTLATIRDDYDDWGPKIGDALGNAALASQQLRLTMNEVRRSPWKVLYQPRPDELEHELLYGAARSFAVATGELRVTAETVQRILDRHGDRLADEPELRNRLTDDLLGQLDAYREAQDRLMTTLFTTGSAAPSGE